MENELNSSDQSMWKPLIDQFIEINSHTNLSAIRTPEDIWVKHIKDSLEINKVIALKP